jgi:multicomponent Na+:H+ antiporter subunit D
MILLVVFFMIVGFGTKAGMFPLHAWLPVAHPVAPAPASALMSGNLTKMGVLAIIRVIYYLIGPEFLRGTWVQYAFLTLSLLTIIMGSMMAYKEQILKKRLAYSTISQLSYILFGVAL